MNSTYFFADAPYFGDLTWFYHFTTSLRDGFAVMDDFGNLQESDCYTRTFAINR